MSADDWNWLAPEYIALVDGAIGAFLGATGGARTGLLLHLDLEIW